MKLNLERDNFSRFGSSLSIRRLVKRWPGYPVGLYLQKCGHGVAFRIELTRRGRKVRFRDDASPARLRLRAAGGGWAEICYETPDRVRIRARGVTVRLTRPQTKTFEYAFERGKNRWQLNLFDVRSNYLLTALQGCVRVSAPWTGTRARKMAVEISGEPRPVDTALEVFLTTMPAARKTVPFAQCVREVDREFRAFRDRITPVPAAYRVARELAAYVLWGATVAPRGHFQRPAILMSKNHMTSVWSWDHCFNAVALAPSFPNLAWDQLMVMFDHQDEDGCLPDCINAESMVWNFCKPPIHGWALRSLMNTSRTVTPARLRDFYPRLVRWTDWWFRTRDDDGDGIPQYNHGNDSGWDNATCFDVGVPIEGPDLAAFLVLQMDVLADMAWRLGRSRESTAWRHRANRLLVRMIRHFWRDGRFVPMQSGTHKSGRQGDSLIPFAPLVLGRRLPEPIRSELIAGLCRKGRFLTRWGLATESPASKLYEPDGYWRGPIWAPSTYLVYTGLVDCGETRLAREIARRFCDVCARSGFAENFDALTGAPLRDKSYTWTASVFLRMAHDLSMD